MARTVAEQNGYASTPYIASGFAATVTHDDDGENIFRYTTAEATALGVENPALEAMGILSWTDGNLSIIDGNGNTRLLKWDGTDVDSEVPIYVRIAGIRATGTTLLNGDYVLLLV